MKTQNSFKDIPVREFMSNRVHSLMVDDTIHDAVEMMIDNRLTTVPVVNGENKCVGILSRSDMTELFMAEDSELSNVRESSRMSLEWLSQSLETSDTRLVKELMTYEVTTIGQDQTLKHASEEMVRLRIHHLPVVDDQQCVTGIVSAFDVVKAVANAG